MNIIARIEEFAERMRLARVSVGTLKLSQQQEEVLRRVDPAWKVVEDALRRDLNDQDVFVSFLAGFLKFHELAVELGELRASETPENQDDVDVDLIVAVSEIFRNDLTRAFGMPDYFSNYLLATQGVHPLEDAIGTVVANWRARQ